MINSENISNRPAFQYKNVTGKLTTEFYGKVSTKLVRAGSLLQGTLAIRKANLVEKKKIREGQKRDRFEDRLEANPNVEKNKNFINRIPRPGSGVGILGWFKNFIGSVALGFFATKLLGSLPLFQGILKGVLGVADFVASTGVFLVNAITTFIDIGYKAYDSTAGFLKAIGGDNAIGIFDTFTDRLSSLIDVIIVASIVRGGGLGLGIGGPGAIGSSVARAERARQEEIRAAKDAVDAKKGPKPKAKPIRGGGAGAVAGTIEEERQRKRTERLQKRNEKIDKRLQELEKRRQESEKISRRSLAFRRRRQSIKGITLDKRKKLARLAKERRKSKLLSLPAGQQAYEIDRFLSGGGITNIPEQRIFKRISDLDRIIEKNQVFGQSAAMKRNLAERDRLVKKLTKGQALRLRKRGRRVTTLKPRGLGLLEQVVRSKKDVDFISGMEADPKMAAAAFADAESDFRGDEKSGVRGGRVARVARDTSGMSRLDRAVSRVPVGVTARGLGRIPDRLMLKLFGRRVARLAGRLPIIGGLVDFGISLLEGDPIPKAATRAIFAGIGGGVGAFLGSLTGPFAPILAPIGALLVGGLADSLGSFLYDSIIKGFFPSASNDAGGNILTNALKPIGELFGGLWGRINEFLFGKPPSSLDKLGTFIQDRPGYKKSDGTTPPPPLIPPPLKKSPPPFFLGKRKAPKAGKVNFGSLLDLVTSGEGGLNSVNRGNAGDTPGGAKSILGKNLTDMTVDEVHAQQYPYGAGLNAVGKYQIIPSTMEGFIKYLRSQGIDTSKRKFDASIQNMFGPYSINKKRAKVGRFLTGDTSVSLDTAQLELAAEYASIGVPYDMKKGSYNGKYPLRDIKKGESLYSGTGSNYAPAAHTDQIRSMLQKLRQQASYEKSDSTVVVNSSTIANNITPVPIPTNNNVPVIASSGGDGYDPFQSTYKIG